VIKVQLTKIKKSLNRKVPFIGIDIDLKSKKNLNRVLNKVKSMFPHEKISVRESSSRKGYHIKIKKEVTILENVLYRVLLDDDNTRIKLSLLKMVISNGTEKHFDLLFDEKNNKKAGIWKKVKMDKDKGIVGMSEDNIQEELNHKMVRILFFMFKHKEHWLVTGEISNDIGMGFPTFKKSMDKLIYLRLVQMKRDKGYKAYKLNFKGEI